MLITGWFRARFLRWAGTTSPRRPAVYVGGIVVALMLWPFTVLILLIDGMNWLVRLVPPVRRVPSRASWAGALVVLLAFYAVAPKADPEAEGLAAAALATPAPTTVAITSTPTPSVTPSPTLMPIPKPTATPSLAATPAPPPVPTVAPTPTPPPTPPPAPFTVLRPANGATVNIAAVTFSGTAPAGATIVRDIPLFPDTTTNAGADGKWSMQIDLSEGQNDFTFRVGDDRATEIKVAVTYVKQAPVATIGKPVVIDGIEVTILKVQVSTGSTYWKPPKGYVWVGYQIRLRAVDESRVVSSSDWVALADGTKQGEWTLTGNQAWEPLLSLTTLRAGASTSGWIAFEMPKPSKYIRLIYDPSFFSDEAKITLDVKYP